MDLQKNSLSDSIVKFVEVQGLYTQTSVLDFHIRSSDYGSSEKRARYTRISDLNNISMPGCQKRRIQSR